MVPLIDLARRTAALQPDLDDAIARILASGWLLLGPELDVFESEFARYCGASHAVGVGSGTDALAFALRAIGVGPYDEVIVPAFTAVPTAAAICAVGAVPVPVDINSDTAVIDPAAAQAAMTSATKAIAPVHLYGRPAPTDELTTLGLPIVEDAAQAHGALRSVTGRAVAYSFYPTKNLGGIGDGGAVVTNDAVLAEKIRLLRHHGMSEQYVHTEIATNSRLSEIEAAALRIGLRTLDADNARRREIAARYREAAPRLRWQATHPDHVYHLCVLRVGEREAFRAKLPCRTGVHYPLALTQQPAYQTFGRHPCPNAEAWAAQCVTLPCFPEMTDDEVDQICLALRQCP